MLYQQASDVIILCFRKFGKFGNFDTFDPVPAPPGFSPLPTAPIAVQSPARGR